MVTPGCFISNPPKSHSQEGCGPRDSGFELGTGKAVAEEVHPGTMAKAALAPEVFSGLSDLVG